MLCLREMYYCYTSKLSYPEMSYVEHFLCNSTRAAQKTIYCMGTVLGGVGLILVLRQVQLVVWKSFAEAGSNLFTNTTIDMEGKS